MPPDAAKYIMDLGCLDETPKTRTPLEIPRLQVVKPSTANTSKPIAVSTPAVAPPKPCVQVPAPTPPQSLWERYSLLWESPRFRFVAVAATLGAIGLAILLT